MAYADKVIDDGAQRNHQNVGGSQVRCWQSPSFLCVSCHLKRAFPQNMLRLRLQFAVFVLIIRFFDHEGNQTGICCVVIVSPAADFLSPVRLP
jgi:hypothetical protein